MPPKLRSSVDSSSALARLLVTNRDRFTREGGRKRINETGEEGKV
jgi:hypothetical protein